MRYVRSADGREAIPDDLPPSTRAVAFLLEHATQRREGGLPLPCPCPECLGHRATVRCTKSADGRTLIVGPA
jgi:hypothetical protein